MDREDLTLAVIGGGKMGGALAEALVASGRVARERLTVTVRHPASLEAFRAKGIRARPAAENAAVAREAAVLILAVHPDETADALDQLRPSLREDHLLISIVTGREHGQARGDGRAAAAGDPRQPEHRGPRGRVGHGALRGPLRHRGAPGAGAVALRDGGAGRDPRRAAHERLHRPGRVWSGLHLQDPRGDGGGGREDGAAPRRLAADLGAGVEGGGRAGPAHRPSPGVPQGRGHHPGRLHHRRHRQAAGAGHLDRADRCGRGVHAQGRGAVGGWLIHPARWRARSSVLPQPHPARKSLDRDLRPAAADGLVVLLARGVLAGAVRARRRTRS